MGACSASPSKPHYMMKLVNLFIPSWWVGGFSHFHPNDYIAVLVESLSHIWLLVTTWIATHQASLSFTISRNLFRIHVYCAGDAMQPSNPLSTPSPHPQSFLASGSFPMSRHCSSDGQTIGALASVLPMNIQGWFLLGLTDLISLWFKGLSRIFSSITVQKHQFFNAMLPVF